MTVKTVIQQELLALHRVRDQFVAAHDDRQEIFSRGVRALAHAEVVDDEQRHSREIGRYRRPRDLCPSSFLLDQSELAARMYRSMEGDAFVLFLKEVPPSLLETAAVDIARSYTVAFVNVQEVPNRPEAATLLGSGVLVSAGRTRAILTAHHVLRILPKTGRLCILLEKTPTPHTLDLTGIRVLEIARGSDDSVGPDLGAVVLSPAIAGAIGAKRRFYNMDAVRDEMLNNPPDLDFGPWTVQGYLDERTVVTPDADRQGITTAFYNFSGFGGVAVPPATGHFDYFEFPLGPAGDVATPTSWGGVSGGGLWQFFLKRRDGEWSVQRTILSGVAFYQHPPMNGTHGSIRCHGRQSVYGVAYEKIASTGL